MHASLERPLATSHAHAAVASEVGRVRAHLARAERSCRANPPPTVDPTAQLLRALLLDEVASYRSDGRFPRHHESGVATPVFVDAAGTHCAVGHLLAISGQGALVERIARERNRAYVHELADEPSLVAWLSAVGLSAAEAAAIQPTYCSTPASALCSTCFSSSVIPPAAAVLDGHVISSDRGAARIEIDAIVGSNSGVGIGSLVDVRLHGSTPVVAGSRVVVPVSSSYSVDAGYSPNFVDGLVVSSDGRVGCEPPALDVTVSQFESAMLSASCASELAAIDARWGRSSCDGEYRSLCTASPFPASADLLMTVAPALVALALARRRVRQRVAGR